MGKYYIRFLRTLQNAESFRKPLFVKEVVVFQSGDSYCACPRCDSLLDREYMRFCDRCGQHLSWKMLKFAKVVKAPRKR